MTFPQVKHLTGIIMVCLLFDYNRLFDMVGSCMNRRCMLGAGSAGRRADEPVPAGAPTSHASTWRNNYRFILNVIPAHPPFPRDRTYSP